MTKATKLRLLGGAILLIMLWAIGRFDIQGPGVFIAIFGFAAAFEFLVVRPLIKDE